MHSSPRQSAAVQTHCVQSAIVDNRLRRERPAPRGSMCRDSSVKRELATMSYNTNRSQLPSHRALHPLLTVVDAHRRKMRQAEQEDQRQQSIQICKTPVTRTVRLNLDNALLIPCASLLTVSRTINFLFKVLFIFPSRYLFAIGLVPIFSFRRSLPPILGCIPKQPDSWKALRGRYSTPRTGLSPSTMCRSRQLEHRVSGLKTLLEATIRRRKQRRF